MLGGSGGCAKISCRVYFWSPPPDEAGDLVPIQLAKLEVMFEHLLRQFRQHQAVDSLVAEALDHVFAQTDVPGKHGVLTHCDVALHVVVTPDL